MKDRKHIGPVLCGWCAGAPLASDGVKAAHDRCHSPSNYPCACAENGHKLTPVLAETMRLYCHIATIDMVYTLHNRKRRVVSDERKVELREQLAHARARKEELAAARETEAKV